MGATLGGLAMVDPVVAAHHEAAYAVMAATLIGSHAPDFDTLARLKGPAAYVRYHRGITHSLPAPMLWALGLGFPIAMLTGAADYVWTVVLWAFIAVCLHIVLDLCNGYGVQCLRPITRKWVHLDALCLFDPYLFGLHAAGACLWLLRVLPPAPLFLTVYTLTILYISWRLAARRLIRRRLRLRFGLNGRLTMVPSLSGRSWQFSAELDDRSVLGMISGRHISIDHTVMKQAEQLPPAVAATMGADGVRAFLQFAERVHYQVQERLDGYEVTWSDVRFWTKDGMPFGVAVQLDRNLQVLHHQLRWNKKTWEPPHV